MTTTFPILTVNDLETISFIAGTEYVMTFNIYNASGSPVNLSSGCVTWVMSPYGQSDYAILTKSGSVSGSVTNAFSVTLLSSDTATLSGKYSHQPVVVDFFGSEFRPSQGIINIIPRIATV